MDTIKYCESSFEVIDQAEDVEEYLLSKIRYNKVQQPTQPILDNTSNQSASKISNIKQNMTSTTITATSTTTTVPTVTSEKDPVTIVDDSLELKEDDIQNKNNIDF